MNNSSKYNCYGNLIDEVKDEINPGDLVEFYYADSELVIENNKPTREQVKIKLQGIWDGEKVEFNDKKSTIVRGKAWLKLVKKI